jgi:hypothetical protein
MELVGGSSRGDRLRFPSSCHDTGAGVRMDWRLGRGVEGDRLGLGLVMRLCRGICVHVRGRRNRGGTGRDRNSSCKLLYGLVVI